MKYIGLFLLGLMVANPVYAEWAACTANGGTIIKANEYGDGTDKGGLCNDPSDSTKTDNCNGMEFCKGLQMNWWSAHVWCESIGGHLANFTHVCPNVQIKPNTATGSCPNMTGVADKYCWTSFGWDASTALEVNLSSGAITNTTRSSANYSGHSRNNYYALCEK